MSETAAGGNYNLSYLSASMRRDLTPFPVVGKSPMQGTPGLGLLDGEAYTIYVPAVGFLWTDSMMWRQSLPDYMLGSMNHRNDEDEENWSIEGSHRVFFQDKFLTRYPWEIQRIPRNKNKPQWSRWILSGDDIRLYDPATTRYLCVIPGERVVSEAGYFGMHNSTEHDSTRVRIG